MIEISNETMRGLKNKFIFETGVDGYITFLGSRTLYVSDFNPDTTSSPVYDEDRRHILGTCRTLYIPNNDKELDLIKQVAELMLEFTREMGFSNIHKELREYLNG